MAEAAMVEGLFEESIELVSILDLGEFKPQKVFWYYYDDVGSWRLIISGMAFDVLLPKQEPHAYKVIASALNSKNLPSLSISEVKLMRSDDVLLRALSFLVKTGPDTLIRASFSDTTLNGVFIKKMIIIRSN